MLQDIRQNIQGTAAKVVVGLIVISFAFFGIESILLSGGGTGVAEVNGEQISPSELQQMINTEKRRLISAMGENIDPAMLDDERISSQALQTLINRKLQMQAAESMGLSVSDRDITALVTGMEQFKVDGKFSPEMYRSLLSSAGFSPISFKAGLAEDMILNQLRSGLAGSDFATPAELGLNARITAELRDVRYLTIPLASFVDSAEVSDDQIQAYYEKNQQRFMSEEALELDYIELSLDDFREPVSEEMLREQYELEKDSYGYATENRVSHIMFIKAEGETDEEVQARAAAVLEALAGGADFAELATRSSDDIGSASAGGDLGFSAGDAFPPEMEDAIASLEVGGISPLVETSDGLHIIKLTERREGKMPSLDELRGELTARIQSEAARVELLRTTESLKDYAFNAEDLNEPAKKLDLEVKQSEPISRSQSEGLFANPSLLSAAFSEDVLEGGHNSDVIELSGDRFVVLRVRKHLPAEVRPLELVRDDIRALIVNETALAAVSAEAENALRALYSGSSIEELANANGYEWQVELAASRANPLLPPPLLQRVFELPPPTPGTTTFEYILAPGGDALVFELVRATPGSLASLSQQQKEALKNQLTGEFAGLINVQFQNALRARSEVTIM